MGVDTPKKATSGARRWPASGLLQTRTKILKTEGCEGRASPRPQSSSASRFTAAHVGFFILNQSGERPDGKASLALRDDAFDPELASAPELDRADAQLASQAHRRVI
jgi:hypothetical protein